MLGSIGTLFRTVRLKVKSLLLVINSDNLIWYEDEANFC